MIRNTICYNVLWLILGHVLAIASAILLNEITNRFRARFYLECDSIALSDELGCCQLSGFRLFIRRYGYV